MTFKYTRRMLLFATAVFCAMAAVFAAPVHAADETVDRTPVDPRLYPGIALYEVQIGEKIGFIDQEGNLLIPPTFESGCFSGSFHQGFARVKLPDGWTWIDWTGNPISDLRPEEIRDFNEGLAPFRIGDKWGYMNSLGEIVIQPQFDRTFQFHCGLAAAEFEELFGYIDTGGEWVIEPQFRSADAFQECGLARVSNGLYDDFLIDRRGNDVTPAGKNVRGYVDYGIEPIPFTVYPISSQKLAYTVSFFYGVRKTFDFMHQHSAMGFMDSSGNVLIEAKYEWVRDFNEGLAAAQVDDWVGFIDFDGNWVIEPRFRFANSFSEGLAVAYDEESDNIGYIDRNGEWVIEPRFDSASRFINGRATVQVDPPEGVEPYLLYCHGLIDREGNEIIPALQDYVSASPDHMLYQVGNMRDGFFGYMNRDGEWVWKQEFEEED